MRTLLLALLLGCSSSSSEAPSEPLDTGTETTTDDIGAEDSSSPDSSTPDSPEPDTTAPPVDAPSGTIEPPFGGSSKGKGGAAPLTGTTMTASGITFRMIAPSGAGPSPLLIVFSGTEGGATMTNNLRSLQPMTGTAGFLIAVLDGPTYFDNGAAGATVLDEVRAKYDVDNDRTYLLGESAGTRAALKLGFQLKQSYFAAYWANDVNASGTPDKDAAALGFAPHGQAGPGGALALATEIVTNMKAKGYRVPTPAPYNGAGSTMHGAPQQFIAAVSFFPGKTRK